MTKKKMALAACNRGGAGNGTGDVYSRGARSYNCGERKVAGVASSRPNGQRLSLRYIYYLLPLVTTIYCTP